MVKYGRNIEQFHFNIKLRSNCKVAVKTEVSVQTANLHSLSHSVDTQNQLRILLTTARSVLIFVRDSYIILSYDCNHVGSVCTAVCAAFALTCGQQLH
jgi:hypothetical protein